ncbi:MAG: hypothetical protein PQJ61_15105 [Spirochaetales bacterium]|uniref:Uncharacterized protein n=1 Tax=Candidatus Thalassospirochaeta sargassi TaxID=3119039 RepID=A0AAJ1IJ01_9SPIO|nr:hypothetical protein [Spirochaetales bacterium]
MADNWRVSLKQIENVFNRFGGRYTKIIDTVADSFLSRELR